MSASGERYRPAPSEMPPLAAANWQPRTREEQRHSVTTTCFPYRLLVLRASIDDKAERAPGERQMLWWLIGAWVASGLLIPALWLLSLAGHGVFVRSSHDLQASGTAPPPPPSSKRTSWNRGQIGRFLLCGLVGVGALILLFIGSFSDPISTMGNLYSALADAQAPVSQPTVTSAPVQEGLAAVKQPDRNQTGAVVHDRAREADLRAPPIPPVWALKAALSAVTPPPRPERPGKRSWQYGRPGPVSAFVAQSRRGTWLFPPLASGGGNN